VALVAGAHGQRIRRVHELLTVKGRREQRRYLFEGVTLLREALRSETAIEEIYAEAQRFESDPLIRELEEKGTAVFLVDERTMRKISDLETPPGVVAVAPTTFESATSVAAADISLVLADIADPSNAGTLLRSAEAFGITTVLFGRSGVDPYHPKVVRGAMGAHFRIAIASIDPHEFVDLARHSEMTVLGLASDGADVHTIAASTPVAIVVGNERHGLADWDRACTQRVAIPMRGSAESLNAAVAGSIALYEISRNAFKNSSRIS
jgi:RNA methyltransferase, TrmH family